jgi:hypothetical protein
MTLEVPTITAIFESWKNGREPVLRNILYWRSMVQTVVERNIQAVVEGVACYSDFSYENEPSLSYLNAGTDCPSTPLKSVTAVLGGELFVWEAGDAVMLLDSNEHGGGLVPWRGERGGGTRVVGGRAEFGRKFRFDLADVTAPLLTIGK